MAQVAEWRALRARLGLPQDARGDASAEAVAAQQGMSPAQLAALVRRCAQRYEAKRTDPGARLQAPHAYASRLKCVPLLFFRQMAGFFWPAGRCSGATAWRAQIRHSAALHAPAGGAALEPGVQARMPASHVSPCQAKCMRPLARQRPDAVALALMGSGACRLACWRRGCAEHRRAGHADDAQDVPLCGRGQHEHHAGRAAHQGNHQRQQDHLHARHGCAPHAQAPGNGLSLGQVLSAVTQFLQPGSGCTRAALLISTLISRVATSLVKSGWRTGAPQGIFCWLSRAACARAQVYLEADGREVEARLVGARLERTQLQQVAKRIKIVHKPFLIGKMGGFVQARLLMLLPLCPR